MKKRYYVFLIIQISIYSVTNIILNKTYPENKQYLMDTYVGPGQHDSGVKNYMFTSGITGDNGPIEILIRINPNNVLSNYFLIKAVLKLYTSDAIGNMFFTNNVYEMTCKWYLDPVNDDYQDVVIPNLSQGYFGLTTDSRTLTPNVYYSPEKITQFVISNYTANRTEISIDLSGFYSNVVNNGKVNNGFLIMRDNYENYGYSEEDANGAISRNVFYTSENVDSNPALDMIISFFPYITNFELRFTNNYLKAFFIPKDKDKDAIIETNIIWYQNGIEIKSLENKTIINESYLNQGDIWYCSIKVKDTYSWGNIFTSKIITIGEISKDYIFPVDRFSPDNDGINDNINLIINTETDDLKIFVINIQGKIIKKITNIKESETGVKIVSWDGNDINNVPAESGTYLFSILEKNKKPKYLSFVLIR